MASLRRVRKNFRKEVLRSISTGEGQFETLMEVAGKHFGHDVGYEALIKSFLGSEVSNALSCLRNDGVVESIGKRWRLATELSAEESAIVSTRRWKDIRGRLKATVRFAHEHGMTDEAIRAAEMLSKVVNSDSEHAEVETANVPTV